MKNLKVYVVFFFLGMIFSSYGVDPAFKKNAKKGIKKMKLYWADEFNKAGIPDSSKWSYNIGNGPDGWGNQELEYYTNESRNSFVENGLLKIKCIKEEYRGHQYTSARLVTKDKFSFKYGRIEVRAKVPDIVGTWPAVWMMGHDIDKVNWPACGEIDIMEHRASELNKIYSALHFPKNHAGNCLVDTTRISGASNEFHLYRLDWSSKSINFYVDDKLYHSVQNSEDKPFNKDFYFLVNLAIGGGFGGSVDPKFVAATFEVDYIRVYK